MKLGETVSNDLMGEHKKAYPLKIPMMTETKSLPYKYDGSRQYCVKTRFVNMVVCNQMGAANSVSPSFSLPSSFVSV